MTQSSSITHSDLFSFDWSAFEAMQDEDDDRTELGLYNTPFDNSSLNSPISQISPISESYDVESYQVVSPPPCELDEIFRIQPGPALKPKVDGLPHEEYKHKTKGSSSKYSIAAQVNSRRRAQNRASQRAFRDRKETHLRDVETQLERLVEKYNHLSSSYVFLEEEYIKARQELSKMQKR